MGLRSVLLAGGAAMLVSVAAATPGNAVGTKFIPVPNTDSEGVSLASSVYPIVFPLLNPGQSYTWQLKVSAVDESAANLGLRLTASGKTDTLKRLNVTVRQCEQEFQGNSGIGAELSCPDSNGRPSSERRHDQQLSLTDQSLIMPLDPKAANTDSYLAVTLNAPQGLARRPKDVVSLGVGISASGGIPNEVSSRGDDGMLPNTGAEVASLAALAVLGVGLGGGLVALGRRLRGRSGRGPEGLA